MLDKPGQNPRAPLGRETKKDASTAVLDAYKTLRKRWLWVVGFTVLAVVAAAFYTAGQQRIYSASCTLQIDPTPPKPLGSDVQAIVDVGTGSFWEGIFQREVEPTTGKLKSGTAVQLARRAPSVTYNPIEGPSLIKKGSYYYLFVAWDFCCEANPANSTYKIMVGRGTSPNGPFVDKNNVDLKAGGGTLLLEGNGTWNAPGGQLVYSDTSGDYIAFHARKMSENGYPYLWVNGIDFSSGWPVIQPQT